MQIPDRMRRMVERMVRGLGSEFTKPMREGIGSAELAYRIQGQFAPFVRLWANDNRARFMPLDEPLKDNEASRALFDLLVNSPDITDAQYAYATEKDEKLVLTHVTLDHAYYLICPIIGPRALGRWTIQPWQLDVLDGLVQKWKERFLKDGMKTHFEEFAKAVVHAWNYYRKLPLAFVSRLPSSIDYWEPSYTGRSLQEIWPIAASYRNLKEKGLTETIQIGEASARNDDGQAGEELLTIRYQSELDSVTMLYTQTNAGTSPRLIPKETIEQHQELPRNPMLNPWNTDEQIMEFCGVPEKERERVGKQLQEGWRAFTADHGMANP